MLSTGLFTSQWIAQFALQTLIQWIALSSLWTTGAWRLKFTNGFPKILVWQKLVELILLVYCSDQSKQSQLTGVLLSVYSVPHLWLWLPILMREHLRGKVYAQHLFPQQWESWQDFLFKILWSELIMGVLLLYFIPRYVCNIEVLNLYTVVEFPFFKSPRETKIA